MRMAPRWLVLACSLAGCGERTSAAPGATAATCTLARPALADWRLRADGRHLRDALGRVVLLRGVNTGGRSKFAPFMPFDFAAGDHAAALARYVDRAASWGINVARVPFTWEAVEPTRGADDAEYLARYDALLDALWARGIYTIVDFHQDLYAHVFCGDGFPAWTIPGAEALTPRHDCENWGFKYLSDSGVQGAFDRFWPLDSPVRAAYVAMWERMAARHAGRPGVIAFEPINEPAWGSANPTAWARDTLTPFYTDMVARLRALAPDTLVLVGGTGLDGVQVETALERPAGEGVVFAPHYYQIAGTNTNGVLDDLRKWEAVGARWNVPVLLGEYGTANDDPGAPGYLRAHHDALDATAMHGTQWEYSATRDVWNHERFSLVDADGAELPVAEALIRPYPHAVAGEPTAWSYDAKARTFTLRFAPREGVTDIAVPARAYPGGRVVTVEGGCADATADDRVLVRATAGAAEVTVRITARP
jgi:endoglycosylceramidase